MQPLVKVLVADAVTRGNECVFRWPASFPSIAEAEKYVSDTLEWQLFRYGVSPNAPYYVKREVKSRTHHDIAMTAHGRGQFKLVRPPPRDRELWIAVEAGVQLLQAAIKQYPKSFHHINGARAYVKEICQEHGLKFKTVNGVAPKQLAMYIHYNTVRRAYEHGAFDLLEKPDTPYKGKKSNACRYIQKAPKGSTGSSSAPNSTLPKNTSETKRPESGQETRMEKTSDKFNVKLTDMDIAANTEENKANSDVQLIDLLEPTEVKPHTLIDLEQLEESTVASDIAALIDVFSNNVMFEDEGFNELAAEVKDGRLVW